MLKVDSSRVMLSRVMGPKTKGISVMLAPKATKIWATTLWRLETTLTKKGKDEILAKAKVAVAIDSETRTVTVLTNHAIPKRNRKGKVKVALKKANPRQQIVPQAIANQKNHAAIAVVQTTPHAPATRDRKTKKMRRTRHHTNRQTSISRSMKPLLLATRAGTARYWQYRSSTGSFCFNF